MKVNREQFLAAALVFATTTGCGKLTDKMRESIGVGPDPAAQNQPVQGSGLGIDPNTVNNPAGQPVTKGNPVNAKQPAPPAPKLAKNAGPANEGVGPANENVGPAKESVGPSNEYVGPSREWGPSAENRRHRGPSNENGGPSNENWPRPAPTNSGKAPLPPKPKRG